MADRSLLVRSHVSIPPLSLPECNSPARVDWESLREVFKFRVPFLSVPFPSFATQSRRRFRATEPPASVSDPEVPSAASLTFLSYEARPSLSG